MKPIKLLLIGLGLLAIVVVLLIWVLGNRPPSHPGVKDVFGRDVGEVKVQEIGDFKLESALMNLSADEARKRLRDEFGIQGIGAYGDLSGIQIGRMVFPLTPPTATTSVEVTNAWLQSMLVTHEADSLVKFYWLGGGHQSNTPSAIFAGVLPMPEIVTRIAKAALPPHPSAALRSSVSLRSFSSAHHHATNELDSVWEHYAGHFQIDPETEGKEPVTGEGAGFDYLLIPDPQVPGVRSRGLIVSRTNQITAVFLIRADTDTNTHIMTTIAQ